MSRLKEIYSSEIVPKLRNDFSYKSSMEVPQIKKIVVNMGLGEAIQNVKILDSAATELGLITGQKSVITKAKKSIATFKLREVCQLVVWLPFAAIACTNFLIGWSMFHLPGFVTLRACLAKLLMARVIIHSASKISLFFLRSIMIMLIR